MIIGFIAAKSLKTETLKVIVNSRDRILRHFPWLNRLSLEIGDTKLNFWGHGQLMDWIHYLKDGTLIVLIGSPLGNISWPQVEKDLAKAQCPEDFELPWDGRVILLKINADGCRWTMYNDWCGSIPVFHSQINNGYIASTLEPVVVDAAGFTPNNFFMPGLVSLLINGHYLGEWTLFKGMNIVPPDCVAEWNDKDFKWKRLWTIKPSDDRWDRGWDELLEEMYELSRQAIIDVLKTHPSWILPLSGGLDSRLIAAVGADIGVDLHAYTYGPRAWSETIYARQVAKTLGLSWKRIDLGTDYLAKYTRMWADWFGSALHFHGMYQMPLLEAVKYVDAPIIMGFIGDPLAGAQTTGMMSGENASILERLLSKWNMWSLEESSDLVQFNIRPFLEEIHAELERQYNEIPGSSFQRIWFIFWWNHVFGFSYYQPMMYDYWKSVYTPYLNVEYGRFSLSLPRLALEDRRLQREMIRRYYPKIATIGGTYGRVILPSKRYIFKQILASKLPRRFCLGPLREFNPIPNTLDQDCIRTSKQIAVWPIFEAKCRLGEWVNINMVEEAYRAAMKGDLQACPKLEAVQALAYRLLDDKPNL